MTLTFGKYCGRKLCDVPTDYLEWLRQSSKKTVEAIDTELERRELAEMADEDWMGRIISAGFRSLSHTGIIDQRTKWGTQLFISRTKRG